VFTGDEFAEGGNFIANVLRREKIIASFFLTGRFYRNLQYGKIIEQLMQGGNYLGAHSNEHLLYCDWQKRDSLLVSEEQFKSDLLRNYSEMAGWGIPKINAEYFLPPYEWYNDSIAAWTKDLGLQLVSYTPGTLSHADYTVNKDKNYRSSATIYHSITEYERTKPEGLNGFILLMHIGAGSGRTDKFYKRLPEIIKYLKQKGYQFLTVDQLLSDKNQSR